MRKEEINFFKKLHDVRYISKDGTDLASLIWGTFKKESVWMDTCSWKALCRQIRKKYILIMQTNKKYESAVIPVFFMPNAICKLRRLVRFLKQITETSGSSTQNCLSKRLLSHPELLQLF